MPSVGDIVSYLRLDSSEFDRSAKDANAKADALGKKRPTIKITVDSAQALAKLEALRIANSRVTIAENRLAEVRKLGVAEASKLLPAEAALASARLRAANAQSALTKVTDSSTKSLERHRIGWLGLAALLSPVIIPALAGVAAGAVGLGAAMGIVALGVKGAKDAMVAGTPVGLAYSAGIATLKRDVGTLAAGAAGGLLGGFTASIVAVHSAMGPLSVTVGKLAPLIGDTLGNAVTGIVALMVKLAPLAAQVATGIDHAATSFANWATNSDGPTKLIAAMERELPIVATTLEHVAQSIGKLIIAAGPMGGVTLNAIDNFSKAINSIPLPMLQVLVPVLLGLGIAVKGLAIAEAIGVGVTKLSTALVGLAGAETVAGTASVGLLGALTKLGPLVLAAVGIGEVTGAMKEMNQVGSGILTSLSEDYKSFTNSTDRSKQAILQWAIAGKQSNSAIQGVTEDTAKSLDKLGISHQQLIAGVSGNDAAYQSFIGTVKTAGGASKANMQVLNALHDAFGNTATAATTFGNATNNSAAQSRILGAQLATLTNSTHGYQASLNLLSTALDHMSTRSIDAKTQELQLKDAFAGLTGQVKANGASLSENTSKGRSNKEMLLGLIGQSNAHAQAVFRQTGSLAKATDALGKDEQGMRDAASAAGFNAKEVDALIKKYGAVPKDVTTRINAATATADRKIADLQYQIDRLSGKTISIDIYQTVHQAGPAVGGHLGMAGGGLVGGIGTGTSDSNTIRVSKGEFIMPADVASKYLPELQKMQATSSTLPSNAGMRGGGIWDTGGDVIIFNQTVQGSVTTENDLWNRGINEIDKRRRRIGQRGIVSSPGAPIRGLTLNPEMG